MGSDQARRLGEGVRQLGHGHDAHALVAPQRQQVLVACHHGQRSRVHGALQDTVVRLVGQHRKREIRLDHRRRGTNGSLYPVQLVGGEPELGRGQLAPQFGQYRRRAGQLEYTPRWANGKARIALLFGTPKAET